MIQTLNDIHDNEEEHEYITTDDEACPFCAESLKSRCKCEEKYCIGCGEKKENCTCIKPRWIESIDFYTCPKCNNDFHKYNDDGNLQVDKFNFCPSCSQKLEPPEKQ